MGLKTLGLQSILASKDGYTKKKNELKAFGAIDFGNVSSTYAVQI